MIPKIPCPDWSLEKPHPPHEFDSANDGRAYCPGLAITGNPYVDQDDQPGGIEDTGHQHDLPAAADPGPTDGQAYVFSDYPRTESERRLVDVTRPQGAPVTESVPAHAVQIEDGPVRVVTSDATVWLTIAGEGAGAAVWDWLNWRKRALDFEKAVQTTRAQFTAEDELREARYRRIDLLKSCGGDLKLARAAEAWVAGEPDPDTGPGRTMEWYGQVAYEAYYDSTGGVSLATGAPLPAWVDQVPRIQRAWVDAAAAVITVEDSTHAEPTR